MMKHLAVLAAPALVLGLTLAMPVMPASGAEPAKGDREFMHEAASGGMMEVELVKLPAEMNKEHRATADRLMKMKGADFDRAYMKTMVEDHEHDVAKFRTESQSAQDPDVKSFAAKTLPTLEPHLEMAKEVSAHTGSATSGAGAN